MSEPTTAVAPRPEQAKPTTVKGWLASDYFRQQVALTLPKHLTPERFVRIALGALARNPKLATCTPQSVLKCMMDLSALGIEADGRRAHLIPFEDKRRKVVECTLVLDYKGISELVQRGGTVSNIHAAIVCENDEFVYDRGELKAHTIDFKQPRGAAYAAYALIRLKDGGEKCEVMGKEEIYAVRNKSSGYRAALAGYGQSPWQDPQSEHEMWKKTVFKRCAKWLVLSPEIADAVDRADREDETIPTSLIDVSAPPESAEAEAAEATPAARTERNVTPTPEPAAKIEHPRNQKPAEKPAQTAKPTPKTAEGPKTANADAPQGASGAAEPPAAESAPVEPEGLKPFPEAQRAASGPNNPEPAPATDRIQRNSPQGRIRDLVEKSGFTFEVYKQWAHRTGNFDPAWPTVLDAKGWADVPYAFADKCVRAKDGLLMQLKNTRELLAKLEQPA